MRNIFAILTLVALTLLVMGCKHGSSHASSTPSSGKLEFVATQTTVRTAKAAHAARDAIPGVDFDLGDLPSTDTYLFVLKNTGQSEVQNVVLAADNPAVVITPSRIAVLQPEGAGGVVPVIKVTIQHGKSASGLTDAPLLEPGALVFNISATGDSGAPATASIGVTAQVAKFVMICNGYSWDPVYTDYDDWNSPTGGQSRYSTQTFYRYNSDTFREWYASTVSPVVARTFALTNTGNAVLDVTLWQYVPMQDVASCPSITVHIQPGETYDVDPSYIFNGPGGCDVLLHVASSAEMPANVYLTGNNLWMHVAWVLPSPG